MRAPSSSFAWMMNPSRSRVASEFMWSQSSDGVIDPSGGVQIDSIIPKWSSTMIFFVDAIDAPCSKTSSAISFEAPGLCAATADMRSWGDAPTGTLAFAMCLAPAVALGLARRRRRVLHMLLVAVAGALMNEDAHCEPTPAHSPVG